MSDVLAELVAHERYARPPMHDWTGRKAALLEAISLLEQALTEAAQRKRRRP